MTTSELIEELKRLDPSGDLIVATAGHFGEAIPIDTFSWYARDVYFEHGYPGFKNRTEFRALCIATPDLGPDPE